MSQRGFGSIAGFGGVRRENREERLLGWAEILISSAASWSPRRHKLEVRFAMTRRLLRFSLKRLLCFLVPIICICEGLWHD
jgi:hypothetical protein